MRAAYPNACGNLLAEGHRVAVKDRDRIRCNGDFNRCGAPSDYCEHMHWSASGKAGVSFWYFCEAHVPADVRAVVEAAE